MRWIALPFLLLVLLAPAARAANRYALANGCWTLTTPGGAVAKDGAGYRAGGGEAERFYLKATRLGGYMLYGRAGDYLADIDGDVQPAAAPGAESDWTVDVRDGLYTIVNDTTQRALLVRDGRLATGARDQAAGFGFERADGCTAFPEISTSTTGEPRSDWLPFGETRGLMDLHLHLLAFEFLGGSAHCGRPWHPYGVTVAMTDCPDHYVANGNTAVLENVLSNGTPVGSHDPTGWPKFTDWPNYRSLTHEQTYYKWVERAWRGGLRLMTVLLVDNEVLCEVYPYKRHNCNEMDTVRLEAKRLRELEDYIDAQSGGPGKGWFRIVSNPFQARRVINRGKLAVVPGIEVSKLFDCGEVRDTPTCDRAQIDQQLDEVYKLGVRQMELVNKFDNGLVGVAGDSGTTGQITNQGNFIETGHYWAMKTCQGDGRDHDREQTTLPAQDRDPLVGSILRTFLPADATSVTYPPAPHCNQRGLTPLGAYLMRRMIEKKMIFDPDHMSVIGRDQAMTLMEANDYPGVVSSHSWADPSTLPRIYKLGGTITPHEKSSQAFVEAWRQTRSNRSSKYLFGTGYGTDQNGFATQSGPRDDAKDKPLKYPFKSLDGRVTLDKQVSGERTFDLNTDGVAHYGLYPDFIQDVKLLAGPQVMRDLARGPESYLQMWERVEGIPGERCRPRGGRFTRKGLQALRVGARAESVLRSAGQPVTRHRLWRWCVKGVPGAKVVALFTKGGRSTLVASTARAHQARGVRTGDRVGGRDRLVVRRAGRGRVYFHRVRDGRVRYVGVTSSRSTLRAQLRRARLR